MSGYDNPLGYDHNQVQQQRRITQLNLDRRLFHTAANALLNRVLQPYNIPHNPKTLSDFPKEVQGKVKALMKAADAIHNGLIPFTVWIETLANGSLAITNFVMLSSDGESSYTPSEISCQCLGSTHHNLCYHRWAYLIFKDYLILLRGHEQIKEAYASIGMEFELASYDRDTTEQFIERMMHGEPVNKRGF